MNHIEIYRPLLIRSGKQEGLSFVNSDMVSSIRFSAGGFDASYGDKMASVLDIRYAVPDTFTGSFSGSLLGARAHFMGRDASRRFTYNIGARYKTTGYLLNTTETKGDYDPRFFDVQSYFTYQLATRWRLEFLGNYNKNRYAFTPTTRSTSFGTLSNALNLQVYYEGEERDEFETGMGAFSLIYEEENKWQVQLLTSWFATAELENYDILGQYSLNELDKSTDSQTYSDSLMNLGVGSFLNHARNQLYAQVWAVGIRGGRYWRNAELRWGATYKKETIDDELREWKYLDSAGYSLPRQDASVMLYDARRAQNTLSAHRISGYLMGIWERSTGWGRLFVNGGMRFHYRDLSETLLLSPRVSASLVPDYAPKLRFQAAAGLYYQPAFYKEMRRPDGTLNLQSDPQRAIHYLLGARWQFTAWERPFQLHVEAFYKDYSNLVPYKQDNVQLQYAGENLSEGFATGLDIKINGEFVPGVQSWASLSLMNTREDIEGDTYTNALGETVAIGSFPRPTDQLVNFSMYFQDYVPGNPDYRMYLSLHYGSRLPFASPETDRYDSVFRMPPYRRVDLGLTKAFHLPRFAHIEKMELSAEVFNLIDIDNTISYLWVKTVSNQLAQSGYYAVPNYLTGRLLNLRFQVHF
ncbi:MAG: TonB-dependent receptor [Bacteroidales bacterium]